MGATGLICSSMYCRGRFLAHGNEHTDSVKAGNIWQINSFSGTNKVGGAGCLQKGL